MNGIRRLPRSFYDRPGLVVAPDLLNKLLVRGERVGRITEVEAYGGADDPASHAFRGRTARNAAMFGPPGHLYVYFTYGMHFCANVVCGPEGTATAVLLRALSPVAGLEAMRALRPAALNDGSLCNGPAKLCQAFAIDRSLAGTDLAGHTPGDVTIADDGTPPPISPSVGVRVGISAGKELPWRFLVPGATGSPRRGRS